MNIRTVSICIFYDKESKNIIIQERDNHSKVGEKYGFWEGKSMIKMYMDNAIEQKGDFLENTVGILERVKDLDS